MIETMIVLFSLSFVINGFLIYALLRAMRQLQDALEHSDSLTVDVEKAFLAIDGVYRELSRASKADIVYDDPTVRNVVRLLRDARQTMLLIAKRLVESIDDTTDDGEKQ